MSDGANWPESPDDYKPPQPLSRKDRIEKLQEELLVLAGSNWEPSVVADYVAVVIQARGWSDRVKRAVVAVDRQGEISFRESDIRMTLDD